uniref:PIG-L family deacetylase n=1 Tax=Miniimonas arenae TaxID=676201 RepID=UPI000EE1BB73
MSTTASIASGAQASPGPVLAVLAHPDDETLQLGGVLALAAAHGRHVVVVTATRGERGEMIGAPELEGTDAVADVRARELADALAALGVAEHRWLEEATRWTDSGMAWVAPGQAGPAPDAPGSALVRGDVQAQARALARLLRELRPAVVLCDEPGGSYGHPDHVHVHALVLDAVERAAHDDGLDGEPWDVPVLAWAVQDAARLRAARAALADVALHPGPVGVDGAALTVPTEELPALARPSAEVDVELDVTPVMPALLAALRRYPSQVQGASVPVLDASGARRGTRALRPDQAAVGWYALSNGVLAPILPVAGLQLGRGDVAALGVGLGLGVDLP